MMKNVTNTLWNKPKIRRLTPYEKVKRYIQKLPVVVESGLLSIRDPNVGFLPQIVAPIRVILQKLLPELPQNGSIQSIDVVWRRSEVHLSICEVKNKMLHLVPNIVLLEAEKEGEQIEEVHLREPLGERRFSEVLDGA